jgi:3-phosphoinositide dependent protein kinase-1
LVDERRHIQVTDFGSARVIEPIDEIEDEFEKLNSNDSNDEESKPPRRLTKPKRCNSFVGTAQFVSPEVLKSEHLHRGTDLWALGCVIFQLINGKHLFAGRYVSIKEKSV